MSSKIHLLPDDLVNRIAAGEVVERPASVLKELLENSLDAGATDIQVVIEGAGRTRIQVSDNGSGMTKEEAGLALQRHATSKITKLDDLEILNTFGFRGEALPSIAAVSRLRLGTRTKDIDAGWEIQSEGGRILEEKPTAREPGTTIEVKDLFFNTPARFKFMKSDATERSQILKVLEEIIFSSPDVSFRLEIDKAKPVIFKAGQEGKADRFKNLQDRLVQAWGGKWGQGLEKVQGQETHFSLWGWVTDNNSHQATGRHQVLFVNRRPVMNRRLTRAVYDAFVGGLPQGRHPAWVLFLDVNPKAVDVNVHPTKREVKLAFESEIYSFVVGAIRQSLKGLAVRPSESAPGQTTAWPTAAPLPPFTVSESHRGGDLHQALDALYQPLGSTSGLQSTGFPLDKPFSPGGQTEFVGFKDQALFAVAQLRRTFILAQSPDSLLIVDQHAAAEKVLYEKLLKNFRSPVPAVQMMLVPFSWEVALSVYPIIKEKLESLNKIGFIAEDFGSGTFIIKGYPSVLGEKFDLTTLLDGMSDLLAEPEDPRGGHDRNFEHRLAAITACKAAVKAGDALDIKSCQAVLTDLLQAESPLTCPHGRPTVIRFTFSELERRFRRT